MTINFSSPIPYYVQLNDALRTEIDTGTWQPGDRLPGEHELCDRYGISRTVVRQALRELELEGYVYRRKGKGSFVAEPKISENLAQRLLGFHQDMIERGLTPNSQVLSSEIESSGIKVAGYLEIEVGAPVIAIERLRLVNDEPRILVSSYLPYELCPGLEKLDLTDVSLYVILEEHFHLFIARGRRYIESVLADEREADLMQIESGSPLMLVNSISYRADGKPIEFYNAVHRGDRSRFEIELVRIQEQGPVRKTLGSSAANLPLSNPQARTK